MRVYLAGPDVFLPDPLARGRKLKEICAEHGLTGVFPLDPPTDMRAGWSALPQWRRIALCNEAHIRSCGALIANLTPFRGPSADPGTVFELGFMRALGRPVFAWSNEPRPFAPRTLAWLDDLARPDGRDGWRDGNGMAIESFGCTDNLMIDGAVAELGGVIVLGATTPDATWTDLEAFRRCLARLADQLGPRHRSGPAQRQER